MSARDLDAVWERAADSCERCGAGLLRRQGGYSIHHRRRRQPPWPGVHRPANLLLLCGSGTTGCHGWAHSHPTDSRVEGFIVPTWEDPTDTGMRHALHGWVLLDDEGEVQPWERVVA